MKRLLPIVLVLAGCGLVRFPQTTTGEPIDVYAHCGLDSVYIEFEGSTWRFEEPVPDATRPDGWENDRETVYVERVDGRLVAHGPEGKDWGLVEMTTPVPESLCL